MRKLFLLTVMLLLAVSVAAQEPFDWSRPMLNKKAPQLTFTEWITEKPNMKGKFVVVDFWATFCGPCVKFTPQMNRFSETFKKDAVFIAVATQTKAQVEAGNKQIEKAKKQLGETYTPIRFYQATDAKYNLFQAFQGEALPMVVIIDPQGIVRWQGNPHGDGNTEEGKLTEEVIKQLILNYKKG